MCYQWQNENMAESLSLNFAVHFSEGGESPCFPLIHHQLNGGVLCEHVGAVEKDA